MRKLGEYLLASNRRAAIIAFLCALLPLIGLPGNLLTAILVGFITLRKGYKAGLFVLTFVALPAISFLVAHRIEYSTVYALLLMQCALVWVFALVLRRTYSWRFVLELAAILGILVVIGVHLFVPDVKQLWIKLVNQMVAHYDTVSFNLTKAYLTELIQKFAPVATGTAITGLTLKIVIQLFLARWWQSAIFSPGSLRKAFVQIRISRIFALLLIAAAIGLYWQPAWLLDAAPILVLPFAIAGLSILHNLAGQKKALI